MSNGLLQTLPGSYEMGNHLGLANEPWLLPITDREPQAPATDEGLLRSVQQSVRPFRIAANVLGAALALLLTAQVAVDWRSAPSAAGQVAQALPPTLAADQASFDAQH